MQQDIPSAKFNSADSLAHLLVRRCSMANCGQKKFAISNYIKRELSSSSKILFQQWQFGGFAKKIGWSPFVLQRVLWIRYFFQFIHVWLGSPAPQINSTLAELKPASHRKSAKFLHIAWCLNSCKPFQKIFARSIEAVN